MSIENIAVIGSGLMGRGIAHVAALGGFHTTVVDISDEILQKALGNIRVEMDKAVSIGKLTAEQKDRALSGLTVEKNLEKAAQRADLIIEAVPEDMKLKIDTFTRLENSARPEAIFASNTSSLSITEMAAGDSPLPALSGHALCESGAQDEAAGNRTGARDISGSRARR